MGLKKEQPYYSFVYCLKQTPATKSVFSFKFANFQLFYLSIFLDFVDEIFCLDRTWSKDRTSIRCEDFETASTIGKYCLPVHLKEHIPQMFFKN